MKIQTRQRYAPWCGATYGAPPPGVIAAPALGLDGREGSHLGAGWHPSEEGFRWTKNEAVLYLLRARGLDTLELELQSGPPALGSVRVSVEAGGVTRTRTIAGSVWQKVTLRLDPLACEQRILRVSITVDQTRVPADRLHNGDARALGVAVRACRLTGRPRVEELPLCSLCNPAHWNDPYWRRCLAAMEARSGDTVIAPEIQHRKLWEWVHGIAGLTRLGCIQPQARALGVAAGHEPVIYWLASRVAHVVATDLYKGVFTWHEANPDVLHDPDKYALYDYPRERVQFLPMNGVYSAFRDETFDFIFSFCSIEHFGSRQNSLTSLQEMARVLRPGGVAAVSTEVLLNDVGPRPEIFSPWEIYECLVEPSGMFLVGDIAPANLAPCYDDPVDVEEVISAKPHFVLHDNGALHTSVMLFLQKA